MNWSYFNFFISLHFRRFQVFYLRMDKILQYSDSESDQESSKSDDMKESQLNYFGLNPEDDFEAKDDKDYSLHCLPTSRKQRKIDQDFTVNISGQNVSLPSVDFWKCISDDEISKPQQFDDHFVTPEAEASPINKQTVSHSVPKSTSISTSATDQTEYKFKNDTSQSGLRFATLPLQIIKPYAKAAQNITDTNDNSKLPDENALGKSTMNPQRKIYFVHGKVSSHLSWNKKFQLMSKRERLIAAHVGVVNRIQWSVAQFSHLLLSASMDTLVKVWNVWSTLEPCVQVLRHHSRAVKDAEWSMCGRQILSCGYDRKAIIADVESGEWLHLFIYLCD